MRVHQSEPPQVCRDASDRPVTKAVQDWNINERTHATALVARGRLASSPEPVTHRDQRRIQRARTARYAFGMTGPTSTSADTELSLCGLSLEGFSAGCFLRDLSVDRPRDPMLTHVDRQFLSGAILSPY